MHPLVAKAQELSRRLYAALPWGYRVAGLMLHLASGVTDIVGRVAYAAFIKAGVEGLPAINGEVPDPVKYANPDKLPSGYGRRFGEKLYAVVLSKTRNPEMAEEILSRLMIRISSGGIAEKIRPNTVIRVAEQYIIQIMTRILQDYIRSEQGRDDRGTRRHMEDIDDINLADPSAFQHLDSMLPKHEIPKLLRELTSVHERAPAWLEAKLSGLTGSEIGEEWGVGKSAVAEWEKRYAPGIKHVIVKYIQAAA